MTTPAQKLAKFTQAFKFDADAGNPDGSPAPAIRDVNINFNGHNLGDVVKSNRLKRFIVALGENKGANTANTKRNYNMIQGEKVTATAATRRAAKRKEHTG